MGPIIDQRAVDRHQAAVAEARRDGTVFTGGEHLTDGDLARGFYVEPTVVGNLPTSHRLFRDELFAPFTAVAAVDSLDEALALANDNALGLTAGVYSEDPAEVQHFLDTHRRRACCTSTAAPARRPGRGRASRRSVAGRGAARPARPASRCTTSRSSCASRPAPSSTGARGSGAGVRRRAALRHRALGCASLRSSEPPSLSQSAPSFDALRHLVRHGRYARRTARVRQRDPLRSRHTGCFVELVGV